MDLDDRRWSTLEGGLKLPYNASRPLRRLKETNVPAEMDVIFTELWDNLHHEGHVGLASYLALPQLIAICIDKKSFDSNFIGLCVVIENSRIKAGNPELPSEYDDLYFGALSRFEQYLLLNFKNMNDQTALRLTLAFLATVNGQPELGSVIENLNEERLADFFEE